MIPSVQECYELMSQYKMLDNIKEHSIVVEKISRIIAQGLIDAGIPDISLEKTSAGALLHDIGKVLGIQNGETFAENHAHMGQRICIENRFPEIADIVGEHIRLQSFKANGKITEIEIVYYADKRVNHSKIVDLDERLGYLLGRYGDNNQERCDRIRENIDKCRKVETKLFAHLPFLPSDIAEINKKNNI